MPQYSGEQIHVVSDLGSAWSLTPALLQAAVHRRAPDQPLDPLLDGRVG